MGDLSKAFAGVDSWGPDTHGATPVPQRQESLAGGTVILEWGTEPVVAVRTEFGHWDREYLRRVLDTRRGLLHHARAILPLQAEILGHLEACPYLEPRTAWSTYAPGEWAALAAWVAAVDTQNP